MIVNQLTKYCIFISFYTLSTILPFCCQLKKENPHRNKAMSHFIQCLRLESGR